MTARFHHASLVLAAIGLLLVLQFHLLVALLAICATFALVRGLPQVWPFTKAGPRARMAASFVVALVPLVVLVGLGWSATYLGSHSTQAYEEIVREVSALLDQWRGRLPAVVASHLPMDTESVKPWLSDMVRSQAQKLANLGKNGAHGLLMAAVGVVIGLMLGNSGAQPTEAPLARALRDRAALLQDTFRVIVLAQFKIAAINTLLTALFFYAVLPLMGVAMPYAPGLLIMTFALGCLPVVGNLLCNVIITVVALTVGPLVAAASLAFLILVHKLEYFVNAQVVGSRMKMAAWELLAAMFALEAVFGIPGLVAAPLLYAYAKRELRTLAWV